MDDIELLGLAAKAAGYNYDATNGIVFAEDDCGNSTEDEWNPLRDDGDALRLAVDVGMILSLNTGFISAQYAEDRRVREVGFNDASAATRRAIVRAAAKIGKGVVTPNAALTRRP